jgi:hypothetical protein
MTFEEWLRSANEIMIKNYSVTLTDLGAHDDERLSAAWGSGETPLEYVDWFGEKYDLIRNEVGRVGPTS